MFSRLKHHFKKVWSALRPASAGLTLAMPLLGMAHASERDLIKEADQFIASKPEPLQRFLHTLYMEGEWNAVLNFNLLGLAAMEVGEAALAAKAFEQSVARIQRIYADEPNAERARSLWNSEKVKDFKGEPYERAATFLYRGLLYLLANDWDNARASFRQAEWQNAIGQTEKYDRSFALPLYLAAWVSQCHGDNAQAAELLKSARGMAPDPFIRSHPDTLPRHLTLIEQGTGPEKVTLGEAKAVLGFLPRTDSTANRMEVKYRNAVPEAPSSVAGRVDWLALTRGGRPIQGVLEGKAAFKENAQGVSQAAMEVSGNLYQSLSQMNNVALADMRRMANVGLGVAVIGGLASWLSRSVNAEADTRYWGSLPAQWMLDTSPTQPLAVDKVLVDSQEPRHRAVWVPQHRFGNGCSFAWVRGASALAEEDGGTGNPSSWPAEPQERDREEANQAFRGMLRREF